MDVKLLWTNKKKIFSLFKKIDKQLLEKIRQRVHYVMLHDVLVDAQQNVNKNFKQQTGTLRRSLNVETKIKGKKILASIFADLNIAPHARIQELGGIIRPRKAKALAIPLNNVKGSPRRKKDLFIWKFGNETFLAKNVGKKGSGRLKLMYVLKKKVVIPKRPYMEPALDKNTQKIIKNVEKISEKDFK